MRGVSNKHCLLTFFIFPGYLLHTPCKSDNFNGNIKESHTQIKGFPTHICHCCCSTVTWFSAVYQTDPQIRVKYWKLFFLFLNQNIGCGYSKEQSQWDGSFEHPGFYRTQYPASYTYKSLGRTRQFTLPASAGTQTCLYAFHYPNSESHSKGSSLFISFVTIQVFR